MDWYCFKYALQAYENFNCEWNFSWDQIIWSAKFFLLLKWKFLMFYIIWNAFSWLNWGNLSEEYHFDEEALKVDGEIFVDLMMVLKSCGVVNMSILNFWTRLMWFVIEWVFAFD